jgi:flagellar assembly factor FliW
MDMKIVKADMDSGVDAHAGSPYPRSVAKLLDEPVVFQFHDGIPAFENSKRFVIILNQNIKPFVYLKSLDLDDLGFVCVDPFIVCKGYSVKIPAKDLSILGLKTPEHALVLCMVTVDKDPKNTTCNLLAPIILNVENHVGRQVILEDSYPVRYRIWEGIAAMDKA